METLKESILKNIKQDDETIKKRHDIENWLRKYKIEGYTINPDLTIDVKGNVNLYEKNIGKFPDYIQFHNVTGFFDLRYNNMTSLRGCPVSVGQSFYVSSNPKLSTLVGAPRFVGSWCECNLCTGLKDLKGAPERVDGNFYIKFCSSLTSLEGAPSHVGKSFICEGCDKLKNLKGAPEFVGDSFNCDECASLTSLEGAPKNIKLDFHCALCKNLKTLKGIPTFIGHDLFCNHCGAEWSDAEVRRYTTVRGYIYNY